MQAVKCVIVGDSNAGKTHALLNKTTGCSPSNIMLGKMFGSYYVNTIVDDKSIQLEVRDTEGKDAYERIVSLSLAEKKDVVIIMFSIIEPASFENVRDVWNPKVPRRISTPIILVGSKLDLRIDNECIKDLTSKKMKPITYDEGREMAKDIGAVKYLECSSLTGEGVDAVFDEAIRAVISR